MISKDSMAKYYIQFNKKLANMVSKCNFKLKYNYNRPKYREIDEFVSIPIPSEYKSYAIEVVNPFITNLMGVLDNTDDEIIRNFFVTVYSFTRFEEDDDLLLSECKSKMVINDGNFNLIVFTPPVEEETNLLQAAKIHELAHFSLLYSNKPEFYEYSEVLAMFFEHLMHREISKMYGEKTFIDSRMDMMRETFNNLKQDLIVARNPSLLGIAESTYVLPIADGNSYIESFEYVLNLMDRRKENKSLVDSHIGKIIIGEETFGDLERKLDIDVSKHEKMLKLLKN